MGEEDPSKPKKKITDVFNERKEKEKPEGPKVTIKGKDLSKMQSKFVKVDLPEDTGPVRRRKKPVAEDEVPEVEQIREVESEPVEEELLPAPKDKVSDEFAERDKKPKGEEEKIVIKPAD